MSLIIPIPLSEGVPLPHFDMQTQLEGVTYTLKLRWNVRWQAWFMDILDEQGTTALVSGLRLVVSWPLAAYRTERKPPGVFVIVDTSGAKQDPALIDLGTRCQVVYFTVAELGL